MAPMIFTYSLASLSLLLLLLPVLTPCRGLVPSGTRRAVCGSLLSGVYASDGHRSAVAHRRPPSAPNPGCHLPARSAAPALLPVLTPCRGLVPSGTRRAVCGSLLSGVYDRRYLPTRVSGAGDGASRRPGAEEPSTPLGRAAEHARSAAARQPGPPTASPPRAYLPIGYGWS